jgi:hypothetical protein
VAGLAGSYFAQSFASYRLFAYAGLAQLIAACLFISILAGWIVRDSMRRGKRRAYDFDTWVALFWVPVAPIYLLKTRRWRGALIIIIAIVTAMILDAVAHGIADAIWRRSS